MADVCEIIAGTASSDGIWGGIGGVLEEATGCDQDPAARGINNASKAAADKQLNVFCDQFDKVTGVKDSCTYAEYLIVGVVGLYVLSLVEEVL